MTDRKSNIGRRRQIYLSEASTEWNGDKNKKLKIKKMRQKLSFSIFLTSESLFDAVYLIDYLGFLMGHPVFVLFKQFTE